MLKILAKNRSCFRHVLQLDLLFNIRVLGVKRLSNLILFDGRMGSGKTTLMSLEALRYQAESLTGCTLFSNYGLSGSVPFTSFEDFKKVAVQPSSIICLDESHLDISNRDFNTNSVKFFVNMVFFLRKLRATLMMTTPLFENIDSKVREVTNYYVHCSKYNGYLNYEYYDIERLKFLKSKRISEAKVSEIMGYIYDTYEMVVPLEYPSTRPEFIKVFEEVKELNKSYIEKIRTGEIVSQPALAAESRQKQLV